MDTKAGLEQKKGEAAASKPPPAAVINVKFTKYEVGEWSHLW